ncbi:solute carrier family 35 member B1 family protein [Pelomyxa schiedti]|nr:solute carrier family 35 member B1 family protein [Pelomyxa schiedti]
MWSSGAVMCGSSVGIYFFYVLIGLVQEHLVSARYGPDEEQFVHTSFLVFAQCVGNCLAALLVILFLRKPLRPLGTARSYVGLAIGYVGAMYASNKSILYVDFPTLVMTKSVKPIPVLVMGLLFNRSRRYSLEKIIYVLIVTGGIAVFMHEKLAQAAQSGTTRASTLGILLLFVSLFMDGVTGIFQDKIADEYKESSFHLMCFANLYAGVMLFVGLIINGELFGAIAFLIRNPLALAPITLFSLCSAFGQMCVYVVITHFGSLVCSTITTARKFTSIVLSVWWFQHPTTITMWLSVIAVYAGVVVDMVRTTSTSRNNTTTTPTTHNYHPNSTPPAHTTSSPISPKKRE